jgi:hypothetical protein
MLAFVLVFTMVIVNFICVMIINEAIFKRSQFYKTHKKFKKFCVLILLLQPIGIVVAIGLIFHVIFKGIYHELVYMFN